jgi:plastocyanin
MISPTTCSSPPLASGKLLEAVGALQYRQVKSLLCHYHWTETRMLKQVLTTVAITCVFGCGGGSDSTSPPAGVNTTPAADGISVTNNAFSPTAKTVSVGAAVDWAWNTCTPTPGYGETCVSHNIVFDDGVSSGLQDQGTYRRTFAAAGTYPYHCAIHGTAMSGTITVN